MPKFDKNGEVDRADYYEDYEKSKTPRYYDDSMRGVRFAMIGFFYFAIVVIILLIVFKILR